jgi:hypothetical protein
MQKFSILWVSLLVVLISGCSSHHFTISQPKLITLKTPKIKYSDMGYLRYDNDAVQVELFTAGVSIEKITLDNDVCVSAGCMNEERFVKEYLNPAYPSDTMRKITQNMDIFGGEGKRESCGGNIYQYIRNDAMDIVYKRTAGEIYFKDRLNNLLIRIEDVKENNATE